MRRAVAALVLVGALGLGACTSTHRSVTGDVVAALAPEVGTTTTAPAGPAVAPRRCPMAAGPNGNPPRASPPPAVPPVVAERRAAPRWPKSASGVGCGSVSARTRCRSRPAIPSAPARGHGGRPGEDGGRGAARGCVEARADHGHHRPEGFGRQGRHRRHDDQRRVDDVPTLAAGVVLGALLPGLPASDGARRLSDRERRGDRRPHRVRHRRLVDARRHRGRSAQRQALRGRDTHRVPRRTAARSRRLDLHPRHVPVRLRPAGSQRPHPQRTTQPDVVRHRRPEGRPRGLAAAQRPARPVA